MIIKKRCSTNLNEKAAINYHKDYKQNDELLYLVKTCHCICWV